MGEDIPSSHFSAEDFAAFRRVLEAETGLLEHQLEAGRFSPGPPVAGFELEAWLVDPRGVPVALNQPFLRRLDNPLVVPELALFNIEINGTPVALHGQALSRLHAELDHTKRQCRDTAAELDARLLTIGIPPALDEAQLDLSHMYPSSRYRALNEQILRARGGRPLQLNIIGREALHTRHGDVMLEAAATSFQIHLQLSPEIAMRAYNAACIISAAMVAISANAPFLFGADLWDETRIPLFEQAVHPGERHLPRVGFGSGYLRHGLLECFQENLRHYPPLLPTLTESRPEDFHHLRLHNGTIWRWNRPLIGFDAAGRPHFRLEHRVVPAGPSGIDSIANAALFYGLIEALSRQPEAPEWHLPFAQARTNFYAAARQGLNAPCTWLDGRRGSIGALLEQHLLPLAYAGLERLEIDTADSKRYLGIIAARLGNGQTGACWQREWVRRHGHDMIALSQAYLHHQQQGLPVHAWDHGC